jgi:RHS repeat-associated protein
MDNQSRIALVRVGQPFGNDTTPTVKYHLSDHLGSSNAVLDALGTLVNREEFTPYGETSFGSFTRKSYRFAGKHKDEESGLYYVSFRYYSSWLGRWTSCDPAGGVNLYQYVSGNPVKLVDKFGLDDSIPGGTGNSPEADLSGAQPKKEFETPEGTNVRRDGLEMEHIDRKDLTINLSAAKESVVNSVKGAVKSYVQHQVNYMVVQSSNNPELIDQYNRDMVAEDVKLVAGTILEPISMTNVVNAPKSKEEAVDRTSDLKVVGSFALAYASFASGARAGTVAGAETGVSSSMRVAIRGGLDIAPATLFREIQYGEKWMDLWNEIHSLAEVTELEYGIVRTTHGTREIVYGGAHGIDFENFPLKTLIGHSHPPGIKEAISGQDLELTLLLGQRSSWLLENGRLQRFWLKQYGVTPIKGGIKP